MYRIVLTKQAIKTLTKMPRNIAWTIREKLDHLAQDPGARNNNIKALAGSDRYRLRVGDWRVIYRVDVEVLQILVLKVAPRGEVYK